MKKTKKLVFSAIMIAFSSVLVIVSKLIPSVWLQGGSVTLASMVPIISVSLVIGTKWGMLAGFAFSVIQMITGFYPPPANNVVSFFLVVMLDYVLAFTVLGGADFFARLMGRKKYAIPASGFIVTFIRYLCHIASGILIWHVCAGEQAVLAYAITYNGAYMIPEMIITTAALTMMSGFIIRGKEKF